MTYNTIRIIMFSTMEKRTPLSTLSLAILGLIAQEPRSGYDLRRLFSTTPMGHFSSSPGAIYPALSRIEARGWVKGKVDKSKALRPRKLYEITREGQDVLKAYLLLPVARDDVVWHMDDLMLRFAFMDEAVGRKSTVRFLKELLSAIEPYVGSLRQYLDEVKDQMSPCGKLAMENGIAGYEMNAKWARRAIKELEQSQG